MSDDVEDEILPEPPEPPEPAGVPRPPVAVRLVTLEPHQCPYLPDRQTTIRGFGIGRIDGGVYHAFMDANFRRSGRLIYQPVCDGCRQCKQLRVIVDEFTPNTSQRRSVKRNVDLVIDYARPQFTDEKADLYVRYVRDWHDKPEEADPIDLRHFLYDSPTDSLEFTYRDPAGKLLAVGICDLCALSLSSVYFYYDPAESKRSLGTFGALHEIDFARRHAIPYYYLGHWVKDCAKMKYKANFFPHEVLEEDLWQRVEGR